NTNGGVLLNGSSNDCWMRTPGRPDARGLRGALLWRPSPDGPKLGVLGRSGNGDRRRRGIRLARNYPNRFRVRARPWAAFFQYQHEYSKLYSHARLERLQLRRAFHPCGQADLFGSIDEPRWRSNQGRVQDIQKWPRLDPT